MPKENLKSEVELLRRKIEILQTSGISRNTIARTLGIDPARLRACLDKGMGEEALSELTTCEIRFDSGVSFCLTSMLDAVLTFELWCNTPSSGEMLVSTYKYSIHMLTAHDQCTAVFTPRFPDTNIILNLRLQLRTFGDTSAPYDA